MNSAQLHRVSSGIFINSIFSSVSMLMLPTFIVDDPIFIFVSLFYIYGHGRAVA
jgi:hypothetical protein